MDCTTAGSSCICLAVMFHPSVSLGLGLWRSIARCSASIESVLRNIRRGCGSTVMFVPYVVIVVVFVMGIGFPCLCLGRSSILLVVS